MSEEVYKQAKKMEAFEELVESSIKSLKEKNK